MCPAATREVTLAQRKQNSGHNDRVEELLWKIEAKSTLLNNSLPYKHNCKVSWNQLRRKVPLLLHSVVSGRRVTGGRDK